MLNVGPGGEYDVVVALDRPSARISGRVIDESDANAKPIRGIDIRFVRTVDPFPTPAAGVVETDGTFQVPFILPGTYKILLPSLPGMYLKTIRLGSATVNGTLHLQDGERAELTITFSKPPAVVEGQVFDASGESVQGGVVALLPDDRTQVPWYRVARTDNSGRFRIECGPGSYQVFSWSEIEGEAFKNADFMARFADRGVSIQLRTSERVEKRLTVLE